jgi:predicted small lipoprotein YifL
MSASCIRTTSLSLRSYIAAALLSAFLVSSCGQKGPLYLPDEQKEPVKKNSLPIPASVSKEDKNRNKEEPKAP